MTDAPRPTRRRFLPLLPAILFAGLAALFYIRLYAGDPSQIPSALIGARAPEFALPAVEGLVMGGVAVPGLSRADLDGKVSVVNVFASWCVPCRDEHPLLVDLALDERIHLVGLNYKDDPENATRFLNALGNPYERIGADRNGRVGIDWGVYGVPETFVVDEAGTIVFKHVGPLTPQSIEQRLKPAIEAALAGPAPTS